MAGELADLRNELAEIKQATSAVEATSLLSSAEAIPIHLSHCTKSIKNRRSLIAIFL